MISTPTTEQTLRDAARELHERVLPAVNDPSVKVAVEMLEQVIRSCAVRSAHEIAWMRDEEQAMAAYAEAVLAELPDSTAAATALDAYRAGRSGGLHLIDAVNDYSLAGEAMSCALEAALAAGHAELSARARQIVADRVARETEIMGEFRMPGRG